MILAIYILLGIGVVGATMYLLSAAKSQELAAIYSLHLANIARFPAGKDCKALISKRNKNGTRIAR